MQVIDLTQGDGFREHTSRLANLLTPPEDVALKAAYLRQQAAKTSAETGRIQRQEEALQAIRGLTGQHDMRTILTTPDLRRQYESGMVGTFDPDKISPEDWGKEVTGAYFRTPDPQAAPYGGGPLPQAPLMAPGSMAPPAQRPMAMPAMLQANNSPDPVRKAFLDALAGGESPGYDVMYTPPGSKGLRRFTDFSRHPNSPAMSSDGPSSAAGRYQFINPTWNQYRNKLGLPDFSPASQDAAAWAYANDLVPGLDQILRSGDPNAIQQAVSKMQNQWTSLRGGGVRRFMENFLPAVRGNQVMAGNGPVHTAGELTPGSLAGMSPGPMSQPAVSPTPMSPNVPAVPAGITDTLGERLLYGATGTPHAKDTFTGMQLDASKDLQQTMIQHPGGSGATGGLSGTGGPFGGTGMDAQAANIVDSYNAMLDQGMTPTPQQQRLYGVAYNQLYGTKFQLHTDAQGNVHSLPIQVPAPPGIRPPGGMSQAPMPPSGGNMSQAPTQGGTTTHSTASGNSYVTAPGAAAPGGSTVVIPGKNPVERLTTEERRATSLKLRQAAGIANAFSLYGYDPETKQLTPTKGYRPGLNTVLAAEVSGDNTTQGGFRQTLGGALKSDQDKAAEHLYHTIINPLLRLDSGSATPEQETQRYMSMLPNANDGEERVLAKMQYLDSLFQQVVDFSEAIGVPIEQMLQNAATNPEQAKILSQQFNARRGGPRSVLAPETAPAQAQTQVPEDRDPQADAVLNRYRRQAP